MSTLAPVRPVTADLIELELPSDSTVLVFSDLHLRQRSSAQSRATEHEIAQRLGTVDGPCAIILNGDVFELWGEPEGTVEGALGAHPELATALAAVASGPDRHLIVVAGNHDAALAWDDAAVQTLAGRLGARCCLAVDLLLSTPAGPRRVRCEHGHAFDPVNASRDPRDPLDSPLGQHIIQEVMPQVTRTRFLSDLDGLGDLNASGQFIASRLLYRQLGSRAWWLGVPLLASLLLRVPWIVRVLAGSDDLRNLHRWLVIASAGVAVNVAGLIAVLAFLARRIYSELAASSAGPRGAHSNGAPRAAAAALCAQGFAGFITSHTHQPELAPVPGGFYANSGCCQRMVELHPARLGLPPVFVPVLRRSWIEMDVERDVRARLVVAQSPTGETTWLERLAMRRSQPLPATPEVVATLPGEAGWPLRSLDLTRRHRHERVRARAALAVSAAGLLSLASAVTLPLQGRLRALLELFPLYVPQTAAASVSFLSIGLLLLGRGLRRGHRLAWGLAAGLLGLTAVLDLLKGFDVEEAIVCALIAAWLLRQRAAFPVQPDNRQLRWPLWVLLTGGLVAGVSTVLVLLTGQHQDKDLSARAIAERLLGDSRLPLPSTAPLVTPALLATGFAVLLACGLLLTRTRRRPPLTAAQRQADLRRARRIVAEHGGDTLAYFTLRDDKCWFFTGDCVVAYALRDGVCLVAPDPVGPPEQWATAWADFTEFTDRHGWPVTVIGAGAGWLPIYQAAGLRSMYMGDEAIVDCQAFSLHGRPMKGLRSAYHRVQRAGFEVRFFDPATLEPELAAALRDMLTKSRRGQVERGFSMTLSRVFDPADTGLLLSVAFRPDGRPAGFCQWTPAGDISGWSLDLMRRDAGTDLPNGLIDFLIIETIAYAKSHGQWGLSLNFAVMRAVLAGEQGGGILTDLQRRILTKFSDTMQIASLWHFNEKFKPYWRPRYLALGRLTSAPAQSLAIADAEGVTELPLIGRFLGQNAEQTTMDEPGSGTAGSGTAESGPATPGAVEPGAVVPGPGDGEPELVTGGPGRL